MSQNTEPVEDPFTSPLSDAFWDDMAERLKFDPEGWKSAVDAAKHWEFVNRGATEGEREAREAVVRSIWSLRHAQATQADIERLADALRAASDNLMQVVSKGALR